MFGARIGTICLAILLLSSVGCTDRQGLEVGRGSIRGRVIDLVTGEPLGNTFVTVKDSTVLTDNHGLFSFDNVETGFYWIESMRYGYGSSLRRSIKNPLRVYDRQIASIDIEMPPCDWGPRSEDSVYLQGYQYGVALADEELLNGRATVYGSRKLSRYTGLPSKVVAGLMVTSEREGLTDGHNDKMFEYISSNGIPPDQGLGKLRSWYDVTQEFLAQRRESPPARLWIEGPAIFSPDSAIAVRFVVLAGDTYFAVYRPWLEVIGLPPPEFDTLEVAWCRDNAEVAIVRTGQRDFGVLDLRTREFRQVYRQYRPRRVLPR